MNTGAPFAVHTYRDHAKAHLAGDIFDYIDGAAGDEITLDDNRRAYDAIKLRPLCLRDVAGIDTGCKILDSTLPAPVLIGPTAFHALVDTRGEIATANAARTTGQPMIASSFSSFSLEEIAQQSHHENLWLQCYIFKQRDITEDLLKRAESAGYKALVLTVGIPVHGRRYRDLRNRFRLPADCDSGNFPSHANDGQLRDFANQMLDASVTWRDVEWLQSLTSLPIFLKGILNPKDAERACSMNLDGLIVSNHGGRQLDTSEAAISVLPDIFSSVSGALPILIDGGITRGTDILKAIALGADAILLGRPILWALAVAGESGVKALLEMLRDDLEVAMQLSGCRTVSEIRHFAADLCSLPKGLSVDL